MPKLTGICEVCLVQPLAKAFSGADIDACMASRGDHLVRSGHTFVNGSGLLGRLVGSGMEQLLDQLDQRLVTGGIDATLPDGRRRRIGFHAPGPVAVVRLNSWYALVRLATSGSIGWYRAWAKGEWASPDPVPLFALFMANAVELGDTARAKGSARWFNRVRHLFQDNDLIGSRRNIAAHYDLGNDFYAEWLDPTMSYSSARFLPGMSLEEAQHHKLNLLLDRLDLSPGQRLLEIGCGWGSLAIEAAKRGAQVIGLTLSTEQKAWADRKVVEAGLSERIEIRLQDYRQFNEPVDSVASVEMVEAVGQRWWPTYLDCIARNVRPGGKAALQFISIDTRLFDEYSRSADFIQAYIFPGGMLIDEPAFERLAAERGLGWSDRDGFGLDYAQTLQIWRQHYDSAVSAGRLPGFDERFHDLWRYYLMYCEGGFRGRGIDVAQVTMARAA
jgi:cyclopropane-fatty-acyl-phospholipid synthase